jgi:hypothetical protein
LPYISGGEYRDSHGSYCAGLKKKVSPVFYLVRANFIREKKSESF